MTDQDGPVEPEDWRAYRREMWRRRRADRRAGREGRGEWHGPPWPFFGCLFVLAFLVAAVARLCGFRHLGRFASLYRERYQEYPSETARH